MRDTNVCVFVCCLTFFLPTHRFPFLFFTFWSFLCPLLSLLRFDFATHRNFRKHLRMVGSRRLKAQSESDVCGWYVCSNWLWCSSPRHHKCFVFLFILACSRLCVWHQALLLLCWDFFFFFLNQHIVSLWRLYIDQCVFDKSAIWLCMCIYVCVCLCAQYVLSSCSTLNVCFFGCFCRKAHTKINYILLKRQKMRQRVAVIEKCVFLFKNSERGITETGLWDKWDLRVLWLQPFKKLDRLDWLIQSFIVFYDFRKYGSTKKTRTVCSAKNGDLFISVSTHKSMWTFKINTAIFLKWKSKNL